MTSHQHVRTFGTAPVFFTAISTILGAIMFLRFGYAVGHVGFWGTLLVIALGHMVTIPTAMAIAEIATNKRVEGGGEYFIISRSFGLVIGGTIGLALFLSQAISVAFYIIAFAQAFDPVIAWLQYNHDIVIADKRLITMPVTLVLGILMVVRGADIGIKALYFVAGLLFVSLAMFLLGTPQSGEVTIQSLSATINNPDNIFIVFAIVFPGFTGMTAGVGLSGDLRNPQKSIPLGTLLATVIGMVIYVLIAYKLAVSASPEDLANDQLIMSRIALWAPIIPLGLAAATLSSALGSYMVAPRTLQALAQDDILPWKPVSAWLGQGKGQGGEPANASLVVLLIALVFSALGDVDFVARIISMFFMVTYGSICMVSFLEHFASNPAYRPTFRSRWYVSLFGAVLCIWLMFQMDTTYAFVALLAIFFLYVLISLNNPDKRGLSSIAQGVIFQVSRRLQIFLQKSEKIEHTSWRPSVVALSSESFRRLSAFELLRWLSHRYGFGTYIHFIEGYLSKSTQSKANEALQRLVRQANSSESNVFVDTVVSPSYTTAISQIVQLPGVSGKENNMVLLEYDKGEPEGLPAIIDNFPLVAATGFDICILGTSERGFGYHNEIHIWLSPADYDNASLMILIAYIVLGHPDWHRGTIRIFSVLSEHKHEDEQQRLTRLIRSGRLPIAENHVETIAHVKGQTRPQMIELHSADADLIVLGLNSEALKRLKSTYFEGYQGVGNLLFVHTSSDIELVDKEDLPEPEQETGLADLVEAESEISELAERS